MKEHGCGWSGICITGDDFGHENHALGKEISEWNVDEDCVSPTTVFLIIRTAPPPNPREFPK